MVRWSSVTFLPFSLLAWSGCHDAGAPPASASAVASANAADGGAPASGNETVVHIDDDGKSFDVTHGSTVTVTLPSNAGTGYVWQPTQVDAQVLAQQGDRTSDVSSDVPGAPKMDVYHFVASNPGTTVLEMSLKRSFGTGAPARTVHATITVH